MLVCNVSLRPPRSAIAADIAEAVTAADDTATGNIVFATLVDDPASVGESVDAYLGEIMLEAASADDMVSTEVEIEAAVDETVTAASTEDAAITGTYAIFNGTATDVTLSNGNLTATHSNTNNNAGVRSASQQNSGKYYFEVTKTLSTGGSDAIGVLTTGGSYTDFVTNGDNGGILYTKTSGSIFSNDTSTGLATGAVANGTVVGVAVDLDNDKIWFRRFEGWNGLAITSEDPATNTGGVSISSYSATTLAPAVGFGSNAGGSHTANFGASTFYGDVPSGFTAGWASTSATFDGTATNATLTNGNLTATHSNSTTNSGARSTSLQNSGKYYFEFTATNMPGGNCVGILTAAGTYTNFVTNGSNCAALYQTGAIWSNNGNSGKSLGGIGSNSVIGVAVDLDNNKVWFRKIFWNGLGSSQNPSTNTGGASLSNYSGTTLSPAVGFGGTGTTSSDNVTANFGQSAYVMGLPTGFSNWPP